MGVKKDKPKSIKKTGKVTTSDGKTAKSKKGWKVANQKGAFGRCK